MKILITGATGFLGRHLVRELLSRGHEVGCVLRTDSRTERLPEGITISRVGDFGEGLADATAQFAPDVVVHLAALYVAEHRADDIGPLIRTNVEFGARLLDAMARARCSALVYAGSSWQHYRDRDYCPANLYAATKQAFSTLAEYYLDAAGLRLLELHLYDSYGEDDDRQKLLTLLKNAADAAVNLPMSAGEQRIHLVHVADLCRGFAMACEQVRTFDAGERRLYRLPSREAITLKAVVANFNAAAPSLPAKIFWGARPYRQREILSPWESAPVLPGWEPTICLADGLARLRDPHRTC